MNQTCPHCNENINFDSKNVTGHPKKCPHCHELFYPKWSLNPYRRSVVLVALIIGVFIWFLPNSFGMELWSPSAIMGVVVFFVIATAGTRFLNIQPTVLIAFVTLLFVGLGNLWQKENFELRNRPYIQVVDSKLKIQMTKEYRWENPASPEPAFYLSCPFVNHGPVPARLDSIRVVVSPNKEGFGTPEAISIGPYERDRLTQWVSWDVFPYSNEIPNIQSYDLKPFLNVGHVSRLFGIHLDPKQIPGNKSFEQGIFDSNYLEERSNLDKIQDFYLMVQFEYHVLGEAERGKRPYWYWKVYKYNNGNFFPVDSGIDKKLKAIGS